jgi:protein TonB
LVVSESEVDYVVRPEVRYPLAAKRAKEQGTVLLSVIVDEHGLVRRISIYQSSGYQRLDEVALKAVRALRVQPYIRKASPINRNQCQWNFLSSVTGLLLV